MKTKSIFILFLFFAATQITGQVSAEKGVLDLRNFNFREQGYVNVKGEWRFYWEQIIDPITHSDTSGVFVKVPSSWNQVREQIPEVRSKGYASYNLKILVPKNIETLAFRFTEVFSGSGYYINGKNIGFNGLPGTNRFQTVFSYTPTIHIITVKDSILDLVVHVSNFEHRAGGIRGSFEIGTPMQIMSARAERQFRDFFLTGAFLIIGIYFMGLFLIRSELYKLFFSLICFLMVFRILILSDTDIFKGDWMSGISRLRLEYLSFDLLVPLFVLMIRYVFPNDFPKKLFRIILWICLVMIVLVIFSPVSLFTHAFSYYMIFVMLAAGVIIYVIITGWIRGRSYAPAFAVGIAIVGAGAVNDMLFIADILETGLISHFTMFIYLIIYAMIFSGKTQQDFQLAERLSDEINAVNENLEELVNERTMELNAKSRELYSHREELKIKNEVLQREVALRDHLFTIIGHDVKGPIGYSNQILELMLGGTVNEVEEREMLKMLANSSRATLTLVENLLAWGRSQTGDLKVMAVSFNPERVIYETMSLFDFPLKDKNIRLEIALSPDTVIYADKEHMRLILRNLISNAIKFTNAGGKITIGSTSDQKRGISVISISDTGVGIASHELSNMFTDREIMSTAGTKNEKGTGIGLRLCKELVELNYGTISVESEQGKGTVFYIKLPKTASI